MINEKPTHLDLFSGIGGFSLAAERCGFKTVGFSEIDQYASAVLKKHWPEVPNFGDIRNITKETVAYVDLITGGFPCQPFSVAGSRRGDSDERFLWPELVRILGEIQPAFALFENVPGLLSISGGRVFNGILSDLCKIGYDCIWNLVPACAVGANHQRDRLWIVGISCSQRRNDGGNHREERSVLHDQKRDASQGQSEREGRERGTGKAGKDVADAGLQRSTQHEVETARAQQHRKNVADSLCKQNQRNNERGFLNKPTGSSEEVADSESERCREKREYIRRSEEWSSWSNWWESEPNVGRVVNGLPKRVHRLRCLGNSIVPQVAEIFLKEIRSLI